MTEAQKTASFLAKRLLNRTQIIWGVMPNNFWKIVCWN